MKSTKYEVLKRRQDIMPSIIIDRDLQELLPPLGEETYKDLEENIIANGCMFPLVTWKNILIDGHNRYAICTEHNIPYKTVEKDFDSHEDVIEWIIKNQIGRRNLTPIQLTYYRGLHYNLVKDKPKILSGEVAIDKKELKRLSSVPDSEVKTVAGDIEKGTYEKVKIYTPSHSSAAGSPPAAPEPKNPEAVWAITGDLYKLLLDAAYNGTAAQTKEALKEYIGILDELYMQI